MRLNHADKSFQVFDLPFGQFVVEDFDNDGQADLAITSNGSVNLYLSNGDGTFQPPSPLKMTTGVVTYNLAGDFNGDGTLDLAGSDGQNIYVLPGAAATSAP